MPPGDLLPRIAAQVRRADARAVDDPLGVDPLDAGASRVENGVVTWGDGTDGRIGEETQELELPEPLAGFRDALKAEIEAARRAASGGAIVLLHGQRLKRDADAFQYAFKLENPQFAIADDMPGELRLPGGRVFDATIISLTGAAMTLSVHDDLGEFLPRALLSSSASNLMKALIGRIEDFHRDGRDNPAGARLLGVATAGGEPVAVEALEDLNAEQREAIASGLGRDTTFVQGPPGTGKTRTIGALGEKLARGDRSVLVVSHTNNAVDQALLHIARALGPELTTAGRVLRFGETKNEQVLQQADLLVKTHVQRRSADLVVRKIALTHENGRLSRRFQEVEKLLALCEWAANAEQTLGARERTFAETELLRAELQELVLRKAEAEVASSVGAALRNVSIAALAVRNLRHARAALQTGLDHSRQVQLLAGRFKQMPSESYVQARVVDMQTKLTAANEAQQAAERAHAQAEGLLADVQAAGAIARRFRRLPSPEMQAAAVDGARGVVGVARAKTAAARSALDDAQQQLAETQRIASELAAATDVPSREHHESALLENSREAAGAEQALALTRSAVEEEFPRHLPEAEVVTAVAKMRNAGRSETVTTEAVAQYEADAAAAAEALTEVAATRRRIEDQLQATDQRLRQGLLADLEVAEQLAPSPAGRDLRDLAAALGYLRNIAPDLVQQASRHEVAELRSEAGEIRATVHANEAELRSIQERLEQVESQVIADATVLATTLTRAYLKDEIQGRRFDTVILDEASMAPIPALWMVAAVAERNVVLVGDPHQLPPIALAAEDDQPDSSVTRWLASDIFMESGVTEEPPPAHLVKLRTQYRMHPAISAAPIELVYGPDLRDGPGAATDDELDSWYDRDWGHDAPVLLVDTESADAWCSAFISGGRTSRLNFLSASLCVDLAARLLKADRKPSQDGEARIIIATPYKPQARLLTLLLRDQGIEGEVIAGTVHAFQGSEAPVVIYDLVLDDPHRRAALFDPKRDEGNRRQFTVGLTRARKRLLVVGDFKFMLANGRNAFLGHLLRHLDRAPCIDAHDVVPLTLSARAAHAQGVVRGDAEPEDADLLVVTERHFDEYFLADVAAAQRRVEVHSPFITINRLEIVGPQLHAAVERGVEVVVVTKTLDDHSTRDEPVYRQLMGQLQAWGVIVVPKKAMHEKLAFIDDDIIWSGSLNILSFRSSREIMERRRSGRIVRLYRDETLKLDTAFATYKAGEFDCPVCGAPLALAESQYGMYRRCVVKGCYTRQLDEPPLENGKMACKTCGGELYFGTWGDKPAWRCHQNPRHHTAIHPNHLKLPAMAALIGPRRLRKLKRQFGLPIEPVVNVPAEAQKQEGLLADLAEP